ncbi:hypothetical protein BD560DRAFT_440452 [Blakeslea trispora]|nr:hypothetical protein BD560DRAFT_440452 [Blakeslea trispora]
MRLSNVLRQQTKAQPFSIYIHWPYCESKCTYCNFNKYINPINPPYERLANAMATELTYFLTHPTYQLEKRKLHSIYFGGGTPSRYTSIHDQTEISMEANPTSIETDQLKEFRDVGVNRLSLAKEIFQPHRVTFDMIYARPGQTAEAWQRELEKALGLAGDHLSMYQLSLEKSTPLHKQVMKGIVKGISDSDVAADMYENTITVAKQHGFTQYEVSSFARHQQSISIGPGAHGRLTNDHVRERTFGEFHPEKYMVLCESEGEGIRKFQPISSQDMAEELIVFGLRTRMGIPRLRFRTMTNGKSLDDFIDRQALDMFIEAGFLVDESNKTDPQMFSYVPKELEYEWSEGGIRPTEAGLERIDSILPRLIRKD